MKEVPMSADVINVEDLPQLIEDRSIQCTTELLASIIHACTNRLHQQQAA